MKLTTLDFNPAENPGVLDTATWDPASAWRAIRAMGCDWLKVRRAILDGGAWLACPPCTIYKGSAAIKGESVFVLASVADGQQLFLEIGRSDSERVLGKSLGEMKLGEGQSLIGYPADASKLDRFFKLVSAEKGPRPLGAVPRLGIGTRMTTAVWPGIFRAMHSGGFAANAIQNSIRELNLLSNLIEGAPAEENYACGFGRIQSGYTGSTYEGLWVAGALAGLQQEQPLRFGADADHVQVKRGPEGLARAKRVISAARYYSFYTLDMADVLDYGAMREKSASAIEERLAVLLPGKRERLSILKHHTRPLKVGGKTFSPDPATIGRLVVKYWDSLEILAGLMEFIAGLKESTEFDLELTIDEHPPEIAAFNCLTTPEEVLFLLREFQRRELAVTHLAPNFGVEKGVDYRCPDGLAGLEARIEPQYQMAKDFGVMLDFHSGDDLSSAPQRVIQRATKGWHHFKVSPMLQIIYAGVLQDFHTDLFRRWWEDAFAYATSEAEDGSTFARQCLKEWQKAPPHPPSWQDALFHHFSFAFPGRRDKTGRFLHRQEFYRLSPGFYQAYQERIAEYLAGLAGELFVS